MAAQQLKSCLYFGTFNPIHSGHLMIAQAVLNQFSPEIQRIVFIPAGLSPHRNQEEDLADAQHRLNMVQRAIASNPAFTACDYEIQKPTMSYTVETVEALIQQHKVQAPVPMIIGSDALTHLNSWHRASDLAKQVCFLQMQRPGTPFISEIQLGGQTVKLNTQAIEMPMLSLSSSWIREQVRRAQGDCPDRNYQRLRTFLPEPVRQYIQDNGLYRV